jgi:GMP synthase (glutamine-hydrolysing)
LRVEFIIKYICEIFPYNHFPTDLSSYKAVILGGSPFLRAEDAPHPDLSQIRANYLARMLRYYLAHFSGGEVAASNTRDMVELIYHILRTKFSLKS